MKKSKFSESQIVGILKEGEAGVAVAEICRKHGISAATWYAWKSKYAGATVSDLTRMLVRRPDTAPTSRPANPFNAARGQFSCTPTAAAADAAQPPLVDAIGLVAAGTRWCD